MKRIIDRVKPIIKTKSLSLNWDIERDSIILHAAIRNHPPNIVRTVLIIMIFHLLIPSFFLSNKGYPSSESLNMITEKNKRIRQ